MAEAAVSFLLENVKQLLLDHDPLIGDARSQVESLEYDLRLMRSYLKDYSRQSKNYKNESSSFDLVEEIRYIVYEMEDAIDAYIVESTFASKKGFFKRAFGPPPPNLIRATKQVETISSKIRKVLEKAKSEKHLPTDETEPPNQLQPRIFSQDSVVGFADETDKIIKYLKKESEELDVISIVGSPGLGKTTLADRIYRHPNIEYEFPTRVWVWVSQEFNKRDVFLRILKALTSNNTDKLKPMTDQELVKTLRGFLDRSKFLIVLDDVWTAEAWMDLSKVFPKSNKLGKVLITSRNEEVARLANRNRVPHRLRFFTSDESWELLERELFGKSECPVDLKVYAKHIVHKCGGLPLAILTIAKVLRKRYWAGDLMADRRDTRSTWKKVSENLSTYLMLDQPEVEDTVALSCNDLSYYLRPCFLYLGMFPEDFEIPVEKLIRLWIAEGFIEQREGSTLEQIALDYLRELINRSLVMAGRFRADGQIKTCRIHCILREFCKNVSRIEKENSFQEFTKSTEAGESFMPPISKLKTCRRVCIHTKAVLDDFFLSRPIGPRVRSFLSFSDEEKILDNASVIPAAFELLKVLDAKPIILTRFPIDLTKMLHLRYIVLSINFEVIPEAMSQLWNLETLVVYTTSRTLFIKANIWKMAVLRHVMTNASAILPRPGIGREGERLVILGTISPESCREDVFRRACNLEALGIRGSLVELLDADGLDRLGRLEKLKLVNDCHHSPHGSPGEKMPRLPYAHKLPPNIRRLTLYATRLDWEHMSTLAMLGTLEVLKLKEKAFMGEIWEMKEWRFVHLQVLHIEDTDLIIWMAGEDNFAKLKVLVLKKCEKLIEIPYSLVDVESLETLELERVGKSVTDSSRKILEAKKQRHEKENVAESSKSKF